MASFGNTDDREPVKYSLRRVEPILRRFIKVLRIDLGRLRKHKKNIERFQLLTSNNHLIKEQTNANTTVQQINSTLRQLECTRSQIKDNDLAAFDEQVKDIFKEAVSTLDEFLSFPGRSIPDNNGHGPPSELTHCSLPNDHYLPLDVSLWDPEKVPSSVPLQSEQLQLERQLVVDRDTAADEESEESWETLQSSLYELNGLIHDYAASVEVQQEKVDRIEDNIESAQVNVHEATMSLSSATKLKATLFPVAGAVLGGVLGGPVGLLAGMKIGGLAAVGGGLLGFTGGSLWKRRQQTIADVELVNLSKGGSQSLPELNSEDASQGQSQSQGQGHISSDSVT